MIYLTLLFFFATQGKIEQNETPFKPAEEFLVKVDLKFKQKSSVYDPNSFSNSGERLDKGKNEMSTFLEVDIIQIKVKDEEVRISAVDSHGKNLLKKKTSPVPDLHFNLGFVADLKKQESANEIVIYFLSAEKKELSKIVLTVTREGDFLVNGKWNGKF